MLMVSFVVYSSQVVITGFGSPANCLVTATRAARYSLSVNVDGSNISLWYDGISSPAILHPSSAHSVLLRTKRQSCKSLIIIDTINYHLNTLARACCDRGINLVINDNSRRSCPTNPSIDPLPPDTSRKDCRDSHLMCCRCCLIAQVTQRIGRSCASLAGSTFGECRTEYLRCCHFESECLKIPHGRNVWQMAKKWLTKSLANR